MAINILSGICHVFLVRKKINVVALIFIKTTTFIIEPQKKVSANAETLINNGAPGTIRTCDTRLRRPLLYPTELQARIIGAGDENRTHVASLEG